MSEGGQFSAAAHEGQFSGASETRRDQPTVGVVVGPSHHSNGLVQDLAIFCDVRAYAAYLLVTSSRDPIDGSLLTLDGATDPRAFLDLDDAPRVFRVSL